MMSFTRLVLFSSCALALASVVATAQDAADNHTQAESNAGDAFPADSPNAQAHSSDGTGAAHGEAAHHADDAHGGGHGNANPLSVDPDLSIFTAIIFALLLLVLWKFAWGPITAALADREKGIENQIAEAHRSNDEAKRLLAEHQAKLDGAADEVRGLLDQARREAELQKQQIVSEAQNAAKAEKDRAVREIVAAKNQALGELAQRSVDTAVDLAGKIVRRQLNADDHAELIKDALNKFPSEN